MNIEEKKMLKSDDPTVIVGPLSHMSGMANVTEHLLHACIKTPNVTEEGRC